MTKNNTENTVKTPAAGTPDNPATPDLVNHPPHYAGESVVVECVDIARHLSFCRGNAFKYVWRAGRKGSATEDLDKALWYLRDESLAEQSPAAVAMLNLLRKNHCRPAAADDAVDALKWRVYNRIVYGKDAMREVMELRDHLEGGRHDVA